MNRILIAAILVVLSGSVMASPDRAGGDKVESWQTTGELPTAHLPLSLDLDTCELILETEREDIWECESFVFGTFTVVEPN